MRSQMRHSIPLREPFRTVLLSFGSSWTPQSLVTATVENAAPTNVVLTYSKANTTLVASDFTVTGIITGFLVSSISRDATNKIITLVLSETVVYNDSLTFTVSGYPTYTGSITNNVTAEAESLSLFTRMTAVSETPTDERKAWYNILIKGLKGNNFRSTDFTAKLDRAIIFRGDGLASTKFNILANAFNAEGVANGGTLTFTPDVGYNSDGTNSYIKSNYTPSSDAVKLTLNDGCFIFKVSGTKGSGNQGPGGWDGTNSLCYVNAEGDIGAYARFNAGGTFVGAGKAYDIGFNALVRTAVAQYLAYRETSGTITQAQDSVALPTTELYSLAFNNNPAPAFFTPSTEILEFEAHGAYITLDEFYSVMRIVNQFFYRITGIPDRFDNEFDNSVIYALGDGFDKRSSFSEYSFYTTSTALYLTANPTTTAGKGWIDIYEDDVWKQTALFNTWAEQIVTLSVGNKKVTLVETLLSNSSYIGCFITKIRIANFTKLTEGTITEKIVGLGDSIGNGAWADVPGKESYIRLFKTNENKSVASLGWGGAAIVGSFAADNKRAATVGWITSLFANTTTTKKLIIEGSINDLPSDPGLFEAYYGLLLDDIHAADSTIKIYCLSPVWAQASEGVTLDGYRTAIGTLCAARSSYSTHIAGKTICTYPGDFVVDGVHPNTSGHLKIYNALKAVMYP